MSNGYIIVDDSDAQLQYSGLWTSGGGSVNYGQTLHASSSASASITFSFSGTSLQLIGDYTPGGSCALSISLDDAPPAEHSTPNVTAPSYHQTIWEASDISDGNHTLVYSVQSCSSTDPDQEFVWLDYILYEPTPGAGPSGAKYFVDDTSPQASWEGEIQTSMQAGDFNQTVHVLEKDSSVRFSFTGTRAIVYGRLNSNTSTTPAQAKVQLDNKSAVSFGISVAQANVQFHDTGTVDDGDHTLVLTTKSDTAIAIDYFIVRVDSSRGPAPATKEGSVSIGVIAGAAVAGALILLAIGVYFLWYRPKQRTAPSKEFTKSTPSLSPRPFGNSGIFPQTPTSATAFETSLYSPGYKNERNDMPVDVTSQFSHDTFGVDTYTAPPSTRASRRPRHVPTMSIDTGAWDNSNDVEARQSGRGHIRRRSGHPQQAAASPTATIELVYPAPDDDPFAKTSGPTISYSPRSSSLDHARKRPDVPVSEFGTWENGSETQAHSSTNANSGRPTFRAVNVEPEEAWPPDPKDPLFKDPTLFSVPPNRPFATPPSTPGRASRPLPSTPGDRGSHMGMSMQSHQSMSSIMSGDSRRPLLSRPTTGTSSIHDGTSSIGHTGFAATTNRMSTAAHSLTFPDISHITDIKSGIPSGSSSRAPVVHTDSGVRLPGAQLQTEYSSGSRAGDDDELPDELPPVYTPR